MDENIPFMVEINLRCRPVDAEGSILPNNMLTTKQSFVMSGKHILELQDLIGEFRDKHRLR